MDDHIFISNLTCQAVLGILPKERKTPQTIVFNVELYCQTATAALSKDINDTVDYALVAENMISYTTGAKHLLVETLAEELATQLLQDKRINAVRLRISKPDALGRAEAVGVEIYRAR